LKKFAKGYPVLFYRITYCLQELIFQIDIIIFKETWAFFIEVAENACRVTARKVKIFGSEKRKKINQIIDEDIYLQFKVLFLLPDTDLKHELSRKYFIES